MDNNDYLDKFKAIQNQNNAAATCPSCGYCPHCGRSAQRPNYIPMPYVAPYPYTPYWTPTWISSPNVTVTCEGANGIGQPHIDGVWK